MEHITNDPFVSSVIAKGYRLRFTSPPLLLQGNMIPPGDTEDPGNARADFPKLQRNAISEISPDTPGFYSNAFMVRKASGGWRPVIYLKQLTLLTFACTP